MALKAFNPLITKELDPEVAVGFAKPRPLPSVRTLEAFGVFQPLQERIDVLGDLDNTENISEEVPTDVE